MRTPVAAKMALVIAGTAGGSDGSPSPVGSKSVSRNLTSMLAGACGMRAGWYWWKFFCTTRPLSIVISQDIRWLMPSMKPPCTRFSDWLGLTICRPMSTAHHARLTLMAFLRVDRHLDDVRDVAGVRELERHALAGALRQRPAAIPVRHVAHGLEHAARARRIESARGAGADRVVQQVDPVLQRILAGGDGDLVDEALLHERDAVGGRRPQRADGNAERRHVLGRDQHVLDEAARELVGRHDGVRAGDEIAIGDQLAARVQAGLEEVEARRAGTGRAPCRLRATRAA